MLSFKEAAIKVLKSSNKPLSAREITELALSSGFIATEGKTPEMTMASVIYTDISSNKSSEFLKVGSGLFALKNQTTSVYSPLLLIEQHNESIRKALKDKLHNMDPYLFESLIADLLQKMGYEKVQVTKKSGDGGIDINAELTAGGITNVKTVIQVKRYQKNVEGKIVRELRGSAEVSQRGLVVTTSDFTKDAYEEAKAPYKMPVALVNGDKLIEFLFKNGIGIKAEQKILYSLDDDYLENEVGEQLETKKPVKNMSVWPLPGGRANFVETLTKFLNAVKNGASTRKQLVEWYKQNYDTVKSDKSAEGYIFVPKNMGLIDVTDGRYQLTEEGTQFVKNGDLNYLYEVISQNLFGFDEILAFLKASKEPKNEQQILDYLRDSLGVQWDTFAQVNFRVQWLINLGKIRSVEEGYVPVDN